MGGRQQSSIDRLPADILEQLQELLRDPRATQLDATVRINEILAAEGLDERLSKSAVNRYDLKMREVGEKIRQGREVAQMWIGKLGAAPQGQIGHMINETLRTLAFDLSLKLQDQELDGENLSEVIDQVKHLSLAIMRLEKAASESVLRGKEIKKQAAEEAATAMEAEAKRQGASASTIDSLRSAIMKELNA